jgi:hypothetical protein
MKTIITSAFSINMLPENQQCSLTFTPITVVEAALVAIEPGIDFESAVGHPDTAVMISKEIGVQVSVNRTNIQFDAETRLLVAQYTGPRLPEGTTTLPEGAKLNWWLVTRVFES